MNILKKVSLSKIIKGYLKYTKTDEKINFERNKVIKVRKKVGTIISNIIYIFILIPCAVAVIRISYQKIVSPDKIPDIFGWKLFIIFDENMAEEVEDGDLVFTKIVNTDELKVNDVIAFRNNANCVTIHKISKINNENAHDKSIRKFTLKAQENETADTKYITEEKVEGILKYRIPKLGSAIYFIQKPPVTIGISAVILVIGLIWICIARRLDKKETIKLEQEELDKKKKEQQLKEQYKEKQNSSISK